MLQGGVTAKRKQENPESPEQPEARHAAPAAKHNFTEKVRRSLPSKITIPAGEATVHFITESNQSGVGIQIAYKDGRKPTEEELAIIKRHVKGEEGERTGFRWDPATTTWRKDIGSDSTPARAVAIRLDAESRADGLAEDLNNYFAIKSSHGDRAEQRRAESDEPGQTPG